MILTMSRANRAFPSIKSAKSSGVSIFFSSDFFFPDDGIVLIQKDDDRFVLFRFLFIQNLVTQNVKPAFFSA